MTVRWKVRGGHQTDLEIGLRTRRVVMSDGGRNVTSWTSALNCLHLQCADWTHA